jgi:hypothetical protein
MSECKTFELEMAYSHGPDEHHGKAKVTWDFGEYGDGSTDDAVLLTIGSGHSSSVIHTDRASVIALAVKILKELSP